MHPMCGRRCEKVKMLQGHVYCLFEPPTVNVIANVCGQLMKPSSEERAGSGGDFEECGIAFDRRSSFSRAIMQTWFSKTSIISKRIRTIEFSDNRLESAIRTNTLKILIERRSVM